MQNNTFRTISVPLNFFSQIVFKNIFELTLGSEINHRNTRTKTQKLGFM